MSYPYFSLLPFPQFSHISYSGFRSVLWANWPLTQHFCNDQWNIWINGCSNTCHQPCCGLFAETPVFSVIRYNHKDTGENGGVEDSSMGHLLSVLWPIASVHALREKREGISPWGWEECWPLPTISVVVRLMTACRAHNSGSMPNIWAQNQATKLFKSKKI